MAGGYATVENFISHLKTTGLPTASHYYVLLPPLDGPSDDVRTISMLCESANIPGFSVMTNEIRTVGEVTEMPYGISYPPATFSFMLDNDFSAKNYFDSWSNMVFNRVDRTVGLYDSYTKTIDVVVNDKVGNLIYAIRLVDAYPKSVQDIAISYGNHEVIKLDVGIAFKYWAKIDESGSIELETTDYSLSRIQRNNNLRANPMNDLRNFPEGLPKLETLGNSTIALNQSPGSFKFGPNSGPQLSTFGPNMGADFVRSGKETQAILGASNMSAPGDSNFGSNLGLKLGSLGSGMNTFGATIGELGRSLTAVTAPVAAVARSVTGVAGTLNSIETLLNTVGIKNSGLGKIGKDLNQTAGKLGVLSNAKGIPGQLGAIGANMGAVGGSLKKVQDSIGGFPGATTRVKNAIGNFGDLFGSRGSETSQAAASLQSDVDKGTFGF